MNTPDQIRKQIDLAIPLGTSAYKEVNKLAEFLPAEFPDQCREGESAVDLAIRMMKLMKQVLNQP